MNGSRASSSCSAEKLGPLLGDFPYRLARLGRFLGDLGRQVVADQRDQSGDDGQAAARPAPGPRLGGRDNPATHCSAKLLGRRAQKLDRLHEVVAGQRAASCSVRRSPTPRPGPWPGRWPRPGPRPWIADSAMTGLTLPGMMELPGCTSGMASSPSPVRGPEASKRTSLAILSRLSATVRTRTGSLNDGGVQRGLGLEVVLRLADPRSLHFLADGPACTRERRTRGAC